VSAISRVALIGLGEVGQILAEDLRTAGVAGIAAWDIRFADPDSPPSRAAGPLGLRMATSGADAARGAQLIVSAVTAASDVDAAGATAAGVEPGAFFLDLNSASPGEKSRSAALIEAAGGRYVEAAVMTPYPPKRIASYMLLGGPHGAAFMAAAGGLGFTGKPFSDTVGQASAAKMCRSVMIKGIEALVAESMLTARHYGVEDTVLASLSDLLPIPSWPDLAEYMISRTLEHGVRRAEEMREAARTVAEAGVEPLMASAAARRQDWAATRKAALQAKGLGPMLDAIVAET
jgi:3-hydroxyisobutyrate dehydrogenase-like beta-hydroxyacid dehydrogenase